MNLYSGKMWIKSIKELRLKNILLTLNKNKTMKKEKNIRSMPEVLKDIELGICAGIPIKNVKTDIHQLIAQLKGVLKKVEAKDRVAAFKIMHPKFN